MEWKEERKKLQEEGIIKLEKRYCKLSDKYKDFQSFHERFANNTAETELKLKRDNQRLRELLESTKSLLEENYNPTIARLHHQIKKELEVK